MRSSKFFVLTTAVAALNLFAQDAVEDNAAAPEAAPQQVTLQGEKRADFEPLMQAVAVIGACTAKTPKGTATETVTIGRAYPLGTVYTVGKGGSLTLNFNSDANIKVSENSELVVDEIAGKPDCRIVRLLRGKINTTLPEDFKKEGALVIETFGLTCSKLIGKAEVQIMEETSTDCLVQVRGVTGRTYVEGLHYVIPQIRAANILQVLQSKDQSFTRLMSLSGDYVCDLANGDPAAPTVFTLSPKAVVKIFRKRAPLSERLTVTTLTVSPSGKAKNNFSFVVGNADARTGELIPPPEDASVADKAAAPAAP